VIRRQAYGFRDDDCFILKIKVPSQANCN